MKPYYEDDFVTLYHGDCREVPAWLDADVLVTDPPYGVDVHFGNRRNAIDGDKSLTVRDDILRQWGTQKPAMVFGRWDAPRPAGTRTRLVWHKSNSPGKGNLAFPFGCSDEEIYILGQWPAVGVGGRQREGGAPRRYGSVIQIPGYNSQSADRPDHPTPKPPALFEWLFRACPPGVIADPCVGSGSSLVAATRQSRRIIGVELREKYCELAANRLSKLEKGLFSGDVA